MILHVFWNEKPYMYINLASIKYVLVKYLKYYEEKYEYFSNISNITVRYHLMSHYFVIYWSLVF